MFVTFSNELALDERARSADPCIIATLARVAEATLYTNMRWGNLPGTTHVVREVRDLVGGDILTNAAASAAGFKKMSRDGRLRKHSTIYIATHGLMVPEYPELSAIVLSRPGQITGGEDGYLQPREILGLDLDCECVNLSA